LEKIGEAWWRLGKELRFERAVGKVGWERPRKPRGFDPLSVRPGGAV
jgi:hypothetical protein